MTLDVSAASSLSAIEGRMQQIEGMMKTIEARRAALANPAGLPLNPIGDAVSMGSGQANGPKPFQFYLQQANGPQGSQATGQAGSLGAKAAAFAPVIEGTAARYGLDKDLLNAVIRQESGFNPNAVSKCGATGMMQLMPETARQLGVTNPTDPVQNIDGGARYLKGLIDQFNGNIPMALAAYNAGPGAVTRHKGIPPYEETQNYVKNILSMFLKSKQDQQVS